MSLKSLFKAATPSPSLSFPYTFFCGRTQAFLICRVPRACILVVLLNMFLGLLYFPHICSCIQRLDQTLGPSLWQGNGVFHQEAHNVWFCHIRVNTQRCSIISRSPTSLRVANLWVTSLRVILFSFIGWDTFFNESCVRLPFGYPVVLFSQDRQSKSSTHSYTQFSR